MTENKMGVMPVGKLLFTMSIPMILSMIVQALYNIVDSIFVSRVNEDALTAVSLAFPIQNFMIALGVGTGVGVSALISRRLGEGRREDANRIGSNGIVLSIITTLVFMVIIFFGTRPFYEALTDGGRIYEYSVDYTMIVGMASIGLFMVLMFEKLLQATGRTVHSMIIQMVGAVVNIILDPIMIFGYLGFPEMGVSGAALATVCGQLVSAVVGLIFCIKCNPDVHISLAKYKLHGGTIKEIYKIAVPSIILGSVGSIMTFGFNKILMGFSSTAAAVFGSYFKLQSFVFLTVFGLNNGLVPIIAYNYGAKKPDRLKRALKLGFMAAILIMIVGTVIFELIPDKLLLMFDASDNMLAIGTLALRIIAIHFPLAGFCIICSAFFQAMGKAFISMIQSIMRQVAVILPVAYALAMVGGLDAIWWSFPIAEVLSLIFCVVFLRYTFKKVVEPLYENVEV